MGSFWQRLARLIPAVWLGAGLAISFVAIPVVFGPLIKPQLPPEKVGLIAQSILGQYFKCQLALLVLGLLVRWRAGGPWSRSEGTAWLVLALGSSAAAGWLHPTLRDLQRVKYDSDQPLTARNEAANGFRLWHAGSQVGNLLLLGALGHLAWRAGATPSAQPRSTAKT